MLCHSAFYTGLATGLAPMYLTEICPYNLRGAFGTGHQLFITIGIFMGSVFGLRELLGEYHAVALATAAVVFDAKFR